MIERPNDHTDMAYWLPRLEQAGLPVPRTEIIQTDMGFWEIFDGTAPPGWSAFIEQLRQAAGRIGYPCFLRTGYLAGKHQWSDTCYVPGPNALPAHVSNLVDESYSADIVGYPVNTWAVRELLPTTALFTAFNGMPITAEWRLFIDSGGRVRHLQPYWLPEAFERLPRRWMPSRPDWRDLLDAAYEMSSTDGLEDIVPLARRVSQAVPGAWSVDFLPTSDGRWFITDMAIAAASFYHDWKAVTIDPALAGMEAEA